MQFISLSDSEIIIGDTKIPYQSIIKVTSEKDYTKQTIVFHLAGEDIERAFQLNMEKDYFERFIAYCKKNNASCYHQSYQYGSRLAMSYVALTLTTTIFISATVAAIMRQNEALTWIFASVGITSLILNIFAKYKYRRMKINDGNDLRKLSRAKRYNAIYRSQVTSGDHWADG